jgi:ArsR family transcriptional regulator, cadmium/lead-responsive transcriptional repressor
MILLANPTSIGIQAKLFRGFSDPSRLTILNTLLNGPRSVGEIVEATGLTQSNVSNHLGCLRDCGLVSANQKGRFVHYELSDERVGRLLMLADELLADVARGVYECTRYSIARGQSSERPSEENT